jgi:uncharacterized protein
MPPSQRVKKHFILGQSDVTVISDAEKYISIAYDSLKKHRTILNETIKNYPQFRTSYVPYFTKSSQKLIIQMQNAAQFADVGPMATVAGVLADLMCSEMVKSGAKIAVVENGGEIMIHSDEDIYIGLYSHTTKVKDSIGFVFKGGSPPMGIGTSSGTFGHAHSLGKADTVTIFASSAGVADAVATKIANNITRKGNNCIFSDAIEIAKSLDGNLSVFITCGNKVAKVGSIPELIYSG